MTGNSQYGSFARQVVTRLALALIALCCVQHWLIDGLLPALTVSSGSMAPTVLGPHVVLNCRSCSFRFPAEPLDPARAHQIVCPNCGGSVTGDTEDVHRGDRLLVNRAAYLLEPPQREDVVLLDCRQATGIEGPCLKRIVGLPREQVELRQGDVRIDGKIAQKSLGHWQSVRILVHDDRFRPVESSSGKYFWNPEREFTGWNQIASGWERRAAAEQGRDSDWLSFRQAAEGFERPVVWDDLPYNTNESRQLNAVTDGCVAMMTRLSGEGHWLIEGIAGDDTVVVDYDLASRSLALSVGDVEVSRQQLSADRHPTAWELAIFDGQVIVMADDQLVLAWQLDSSGKPESEPKPVGWAVGLVGAVSAEVEQLQVFRDIYYAAPNGQAAEWQLSDSEYFVLGDNPSASEDSRHWSAGAVTAAQILGKPRIIGRYRK